MDKATHLHKKPIVLSDADTKISIAIMSPFVILMVQFFILNYFNILGTNTGNVIQFLSKLLVGFIFLYSFLNVLKRSYILIIITYCIAGIVFMLNYAMFPQNVPYMNSIVFDFFLMCLPCFVYSYSVRNTETLEFIIEKVSFIIYVIGVSLGILVIIGKASVGLYSMSMSYYMLLPTIIYTKKYFDKHQIKYLILSLFALLFILAIGSRGAIMCLGVYVMFYQFINIRKLSLQKVLLIIITLSIIFIFLIYFKDILLLVNNVLAKYGIYSRSISLFLEGEMYLSGREKLYEEIFVQLKANPVLGIGIAGDRLYLNGSFTHNILLEILSGFGLIIGPIIILLLVILIFRSLSMNDAKKLSIMLVWFSIGFIPLLVSSSYLVYFQLWAYIGLSLSNFRRRKQYRM